MDGNHPDYSFSSDFFKKAVYWANQQQVACILNSHQIPAAMHHEQIEYAIAVGAHKEFTGNGLTDFENLQKFLDDNKDEFIFGYLSYDLKNQVEALSSANPDGVGFDTMYFFVPEQLLLVPKAGRKFTEPFSNATIVDQIQRIRLPETQQQHAFVQPRVAHQTYLQEVEKIRQHILDGDIYEMNYCVEFFAEDAQIDPAEVYANLSAISPTPFGSFFRHHNRYLMCASPERFLTRKGDQVISQPIKGTIRRSSDSETDHKFKEELRNSEKEKAENLMIVDLVRNDLARSCETGSIKVEELFGIYSFQQVHQMISTINGTCSKETAQTEVIKNAFPMGSMTGAPKVRAMQLIEDCEDTKRGLYSGAVGYFAPGGDFDFNVVIRSIQYNETKKYLNFQVGSAITYDSIAEQEYQECLLKAQAMLRALKAEIHYSEK